MSKALRTMEIAQEQDIVRVRQSARRIASLLRFDSQEQTRIATAVSEIARNAFKYAGNGTAKFSIRENGGDTSFEVQIADKGPGIDRLPDVLDGTYQSTSGLGKGIIGSKKMMDYFDVETTKEGTRVRLGKHVPKHALPLDARALAAISDQLIRDLFADPFEELQTQNKELLQTLEQLRSQKLELVQLNEELEETNRGVVALYSELDEKSRSLQKISEVKSEFLSNMSHEFRTPVVSITALCRLLLGRSDGELTPEQEKQVTYILKAAENLGEMVNDLLDIAKVESGKLSVTVTKFNVSDIFATLRGMLKPLVANDDKVTLVFETSQEMPLLQTDEGKLAQVLRNFISNALKYTSSGEIRVSAEKIDETVVFSVTDTGIGIAAEHLDSIFEEFVQIEGTHQNGVKGTGLGLPLARKLTELLGGSLRVESILDKGSTFSATIPIVHPSAPAPNESVLGDDQKVLIIDDDEISRYLLSDILKKNSFHPVEASGGREGLEMALREKPRAIFLDLLMPDLNGFSVLGALKSDARTREIPVIVNTTKQVEKEERMQLEGRVAAIIKKDFSSPNKATDFIIGTLRSSLGPPGVAND